MQSLTHNYLFPDDRIGHRIYDNLNDGIYKVDGGRDGQVCIQDKKIIWYQEYHKDNTELPYIIFSFDYDTMKTFREFPSQHIKKEDLDDIKKKTDDGYNHMIQNILNTSTQLENKVKKVETCKDCRNIIAILHNDEKIYYCNCRMITYKYTFIYSSWIWVKSILGAIRTWVQYIPGCTWRWYNKKWLNK